MPSSAERSRPAASTTVARSRTNAENEMSATSRSAKPLPRPSSRMRRQCCARCCNSGDQIGLSQSYSIWVSQLATLISGAPPPTEASARLMPSAARQNVTSWLGTAAGTGAGSSDGTWPSRTTPTNRIPLRAAVRRRRCCSPLSPMARRAALMRLASVGHDTPVPHPRDQVVLADHAVAVANQKNNEVEDLRLDRDERAFATQLAPVGIKNMVLEEEQQLAAPALALTVTARTLPHFATAKIKTSSRINQARLKDRRPHGPHPPRARIGRQSAPR